MEAWAVVPLGIYVAAVVCAGLVRPEIAGRVAYWMTVVVFAELCFALPVGAIALIGLLELDVVGLVTQVCLLIGGLVLSFLAMIGVGMLVCAPVFVFEWIEKVFWPERYAKHHPEIAP